MSLVVFPFKDEPVSLLATNINTAAKNGNVHEVWAVAADEAGLSDELRRVAAGIESTTSTSVTLHVQQRLGRLRPGKGDGMNTAIARAAEAGWDRVHFYDADITNFDDSWIDGAEKAADRGFGVVRHRFPRAATDAMITWMITRPGLAMSFPGTFLPRLNQPLGGELLLSGSAIEALTTDDSVRMRSDWGVDTILTYATSVLGEGVYEHHVPDGKRHALYGSLGQLRMMVVECLDAVASLHGLPGPAVETIHESDPPAPVPRDLEETVAYDVRGSTKLLVSGWSDDEQDLALRLPDDIGRPLLVNREHPNFAFMNAELWFRALELLMRGFELGDQAWESLAFRLWLARVLAYTTDQATWGYRTAMTYLESTISGYEARAAEAA